MDNLLVRIHYSIVMIRWSGLAPWEFESPFPGSLTSTFQNGQDTSLQQTCTWSLHSSRLWRRGEREREADRQTEVETDGQTDRHRDIERERESSVCVCVCVCECERERDRAPIKINVQGCVAWGGVHGGQV